MLFEGLDSQTFRDFETIFVDDGSTDRTGEILDMYAGSRDRVKVFHQPNSGVSTARNTGVDAASGEFVVFIDSDDTVSPSYLADLFHLSTSLDLDVAMCNGWRFHERPGDMNDHPLVVLPKPEGVMSGVDWFETTFNEGEWCGYIYMTMVKREFLRKHAIRFKDGLLAINDLLWVATVQPKADRVAYTPKQSYYYRLTPGSIVNDQSISGKLRRINSHAVAIEELWRMAETESPRVAKLLSHLAAAQGRILLTRIAEIGSMRQRIAISAELRNRGFLARLFRDTETIGHRKRIVRAYWFAWLGAFTDQKASFTFFS
jgi:glycosyltransferase involved in cell wall biosynthesis